MTIATCEKKVDLMRLELAALTALVKERLPVPFVPNVPTPSTPAPAAEKPLWSCEFIDGFGGFAIQQKAAGRATIIDTDRGKAARLHTEPGDNNVNGSGSGERCDLRLGNVESDAQEGREWWFAHSVLFPHDFVDQPPSVKGGMWYWGAVMDWHDDVDSGGSQGPVQLMMFPRTQPDTNWPTGLNLEVYGGAPRATPRRYPMGPITLNQWYDFVYHIRWSSINGFVDCWLNGKRVAADKGPNLYTGNGAYLKLANYHEAHGKASSIIHRRIMRGRTAASVTPITLEGI